MQNTTLTKESHELNEPTIDILEEGWLHKVMLLFHLPTRLPGVLVVGLVLVVAILAGAGWWLLTGDKALAELIAILLALFMAADLTLLLSLPQQNISFGPWKAQLFVLALPRLAATLGLASVATLLPGNWPLWLFLGAQVMGTAAFIRGYIFEPFKLKLTAVMTFTDRLPLGTEPIKVLHISDLHVEHLTEREAQVLELAREAKPDLIVISGDYVNLSYNRDPETLKQVRQLLSQLSAPHGVFATLGSPPVDLRETVVPIFDDLWNVTLLRHGWQEVNMGNGRSLTVMGMDCSHDLPVDAGRLARLVAAAPSDLPQLLVYHSPELMPEASEHGIDLYMCGHTHGGQVRLPIIGPIFTSSQLGRRFVMGLYRIGRTTLYVSRGIGLEGLSAPRVRFLCPPEMTLITIMPNG
ncbi:metallophosphoesterase [Candidatus Leptofilum sp.]|uniref:metallophosphoesterase n=1 Tax=Candidatus Leptofilum sp. TaxID=3241576 RepID=UPI003B5A616F